MSDMNRATQNRSEQKAVKLPVKLSDENELSAGEGEGNRTLVCSLGSCRSTIELRPQTYSIKSDTSRTFGADLLLASWCHRDPGCFPGPLFIDRSSATRQATLRSPSGRRRGLA